MWRGVALLHMACAALFFAACGESDPPGEPAPRRQEPEIVAPKAPPPRDLVIRDLISGTGAEAEAGDEVTIDYYGIGYKTGYFFESSWDHDGPFTFTLGREEIIPGWDLGIEGMKVGGRRELIVPAKLAYGESGSGVVAAHNPLIFLIDLREVR
jgi:peptidylprolyl isomerase